MTTPLRYSEAELLTEPDIAEPLVVAKKSAYAAILKATDPDLLRPTLHGCIIASYARCAQVHISYPYYRA